MILVDNTPDTYLIQSVWSGLQSKIDLLPIEIRGFKGFVEYMESDYLYYEPIVITDDDRLGALIWFTNYDSETRMAQIHYMGNKTDNPVGVYREVRRVLRAIGDRGDIEVALGIFPAGSSDILRMSKSFGGKVFAKSYKFVYTAIQLTGV